MWISDSSAGEDQWMSMGVLESMQQAQLLTLSIASRSRWVGRYGDCIDDRRAKNSSGPRVPVWQCVLAGDWMRSVPQIKVPSFRTMMKRAMMSHPLLVSFSDGISNAVVSNCTPR